MTLQQVKNFSYEDEGSQFCYNKNNNLLKYCYGHNVMSITKT